MRLTLFAILSLCSTIAYCNQSSMWTIYWPYAFKFYSRHATADEACAEHTVFRSSYGNPPSQVSPNARRIAADGSYGTDKQFCFGVSTANGTERYNGWIISQACVEPPINDPDYFVCKDDFPDKDNCDGVGNPCHPATGKKYQAEVDFQANVLSLVRHYNSQNLSRLGFGKGWRTNYNKSILALYVAYNEDPAVMVISQQGKGERWTRVNGVWQGDADSAYLLTEDMNGFRLDRKNGAYDLYSPGGQLLIETDTNNHQTLYRYNDGYNLASITNHYGQSILFSYDGNKVSSVTDPLGNVYRYEYDTNNNLISVIYPDTTPSDNTHNPRKTYHYENVDYPNHLTGITDENGNRYATYSYDADGKAITTEHAQTTNAVGQERFELDYQGAD